MQQCNYQSSDETNWKTLLCELRVDIETEEKHKIYLFYFRERYTIFGIDTCSIYVQVASIQPDLLQFILLFLLKTFVHYLSTQLRILKWQSIKNIKNYC